MRRHAAAAAKLRIFPDGAMRAVRFVSLRLASVWVPGAFVRRASEKPQGGGTWVVSFPAAFPMRFPRGRGGGLLLAFGLGGLVDEVHELVELRRDDDLRAAVALAADGGVVVGDGVILAAARLPSGAWGRRRNRSARPGRRTRRAASRGPSCCGCSSARWARCRCCLRPARHTPCSR